MCLGKENPFNYRYVQIIDLLVMSIHFFNDKKLKINWPFKK